MENYGRDHTTKTGPRSTQIIGNSRLRNAMISQQCRFNLAWLNPDAVNLHLIVDAAKIFESTIVIALNQITCAIGTLAFQKNKTPP